MSTDNRHYWYNVRITCVHPRSNIEEHNLGDTTGDDFTLDGTLSDGEIEAALQEKLESLRASLREDLVERAMIWIHDYTDDDEGETIITESFSEEYTDDDFEVTEEEAEAALKERDEHLLLAGRNPYRDFQWKVGRYLEEAHISFEDIRHFSTLAEIVDWAEDDRNFEDRDAA